MKELVEARYYDFEGKRVRCRLCPHMCGVNEGKAGICGIRKNIGGKLYTTIYGEVTSIAMDPIEKKPLYHFYPGSGILSIGTKGCNFACPYCQNWRISQETDVPSEYYSPEYIVRAAIQNKSIGIAYTYSEPLIWFEYVMDCARLAKKEGLKNVLVTNGYVNREPLTELLEFVDAMNIDLKSFRDETYRKEQKGRLAPVLDTITTVAHARCHVELTTLVVTGMNDDMQEMTDIIDWIAALDRAIPWHISRYHPSYNYDAPSTDIQFMYRVYEKAIQKLDYVYCGNIASGHETSDTKCPSCRATVIARSGYAVEIRNLNNGKCGSCGYDLAVRQ